ncbi:hypothetical protein E4U57_001822 [Claviceps arundinis]|uniref:Uncharacterized protein n=1 Tax=Claviceps arundinis TaxID=1623583 RepID=A0ABQ7PL76_9HYPO|nr:hypothetical protein E4U57_001822 [Claviceps arundinis]
MDAATSEQLHGLTNRLVTEVNALISSYSSIDCQHPFLAAACESHNDESEARSNILSSLSEIEALVRGPKEFLENIAIQVCGLLSFLCARRNSCGRRLHAL